MNTYLAGKLILEEAFKWVNPNPESICEETGENRGSCINRLTKYFYGQVKYEPYCAIFAWSMVDMALGDDNKLPKNASAIGLLNAAKKVVRVDNIAVPGALFYRTSTADGSSGHVGIVSNVDNGYLFTIEGNNIFTVKKNGQNYRYEGVGTTYYPLSDISKRNFQFMHTEELLGTDEIYDIAGKVSKDRLVINSNNNSIYWLLAGAAGAIGLGYYFYKQDKS